MADWKGLHKVLSEIAGADPGASLEHVMGEWEGGPKKVMSAQRWLRTVEADIRRAPDDRSRWIIIGPHYFWERDEHGRAVVSANDFGRIEPMFVEVWAGEPHG